LKFVLGSLASTDVYEFGALKNDASYEGLSFISGPDSIFWSINVVYYVLSDGDDVIKFRWYSHDYDIFNIESNQLYNQVILEFVEEI
jgi:hypothetical protein